jgi:hypothetical protein
MLAPNLLRFPVNPISLGERAVRILRRSERTLKETLKRLLPPGLVGRLKG